MKQLPCHAADARAYEGPFDRRVSLLHPPDVNGSCHGAPGLRDSLA